MRESCFHAGQGGPAGVDVSHVPEEDPRLSFSARVQHVVQCDCELQQRRRVGPAVLGRDVVSALRPGLLRQDGVCPARVYDLHQHVQQATVHAGGVNFVASPRVALQLRLFDAAPARTMCSLSRVMSAGNSKVLLPGGAAAGELRFQRCRVFGLNPSNILGHRRRTSAKHRCMPHRRSVLHWSSRRGTNHARWGQRGFCGASYRCRWAGLHRECC